MMDQTDLPPALQVTGLETLPELAARLHDGGPVVILASSASPAAENLLRAGLTSAAEQQRAERFRLDQNRREHLLGRSILRSVLADMLPLAPADIPIRADGRGKPFVAGHACHFNVTHSNGWVAAAFCPDRRIGIDIEATGRIDAKEAGNLSRLVLSARERHLFSTAATQDRVGLFLRLWRMKEAVLKAEGSGLIDDLPGLDLAHLMLRPRGDVLFGGKNWSVREESPAGLPVLAVAIEQHVVA